MLIQLDALGFQMNIAKKAHPLQGMNTYSKTTYIHFNA